MIFDPESFHPLKSELNIPDQPGGLTPRLQKGWQCIHENWQRGKDNLATTWDEPVRGRPLREFPWEESRHTCTLRDIFSDVLGFESRSFYKSFASTRRSLGLGEVVSLKGDETYYTFTNEEITQLMIGFLSRFRERGNE